jgi:hypothetical protein
VFEAKLKTPVTFIIFNRPDETERTFAQIALARPEKLLVIADGPRASHPGEAEKCAATRDVINKIDWDCEVLTNFSEQNMGCRVRASSGLDWAFQMVEETIVLEDDCVPHPTFFQYCSELLEKYRDDERVAVISGDNFQFGKNRSADSYYFSMYWHAWGWASWRRVWKNYDVNAQMMPSVVQQGALRKLLGNTEGEFWENLCLRASQGKIDTWDYQFQVMCFTQSQYCIMPNVNLVSNIGFGKEATHTTSSPNNPMANMQTQPMDFPLRHPPFTLHNFEADAFTREKIYGIPNQALAVEKPKGMTFNRQKMRLSLSAEVKSAATTAIQLLIQEADYNKDFGNNALALNLYLQALDRTGGHPAFEEVITQIRSLILALKAQF